MFTTDILNIPTWFGSY